MSRHLLVLSLRQRICPNRQGVDKSQAVTQRGKTNKNRSGGELHEGYYAGLATDRGQDP
jgi:hypothetical protein